jgi:hypothetical protein
MIILMLYSTLRNPGAPSLAGKLSAGICSAVPGWMMGGGSGVLATSCERRIPNHPPPKMQWAGGYQTAMAAPLWLHMQSSFLPR